MVVEPKEIAEAFLFGDYISMGCLFTIVKVRDELKRYDVDPG